MWGRQESPEVVYGDGLVSVTHVDAERLKAGALTNTRKRMRLCAHTNVEDRIHEMLIALARETYIRPKKQPGKSKSYHVIDGAADLVLFEDDGAIHEIVRLGEYGSDRCFYYRMPADRFHTLLVRTPVFLVHETMNGPFRPADTVFARWSPEEGQLAERTRFLEELEGRLQQGGDRSW